MSVTAEVGAPIQHRGAARCRENRRQTEGWERHAVDHLRHGRAADALTLYEQHDRLTIADTLGDAKQRLVADRLAAGGRPDSLMVAPRRRDVADLNGLARDHLRTTGRLTGPELELLDQRFTVDDRIVVRRNNRAIGVLNGDLGHITAIDRDPFRFEIELDRDHRRVELDLGFLVARTRSGERALTHGYAVTGHVAQGMTVDRAFVLAGPGVSREWGYAAMTRGRHENRLYASCDPDDRQEYAPISPSAHRRDPRADLARALSTSGAEPLALEHRRERSRGIEL